jgi:hypothetical protein
VIFVGLGLFFFTLGIFIGLPVILFRPAKFVLCFTIGSLLFIGSFAFLKGPADYFKSILSRETLPFAFAYFGSLGFALYAALIAKSYLLVVFSCILQVRSDTVRLFQSVI